MSSIPILLLIDCEPDEREPLPDRKLPWTGFERLYDLLSAEREGVAARTGRSARFNWFWRMDPQVEAIYGSAAWPADAYASQIADLTRAGDALGLHAHPFRWNPAAERWLIDHADLSWVENCLRQSFAAYRSAFGRDCALFRFGDGWFDEAIIPVLEELGARIDLTVEPGVAPRRGLVDREMSTGWLPDRRGAPRQPYRPARSNFRRHDTTGRTWLWELPVSTAPRIKRPKWHRPARLLRWWRSPKRHLSQFNFEIAPKRFPHLFDRVLSTASPRYAAICVRSDAGVTRERRDVIARNLDSILRHPLAKHFSFTTPEDALAQLTRARPRP